MRRFRLRKWIFETFNHYFGWRKHPPVRNPRRPQARPGTEPLEERASASLLWDPLLMPVVLPAHGAALGEEFTPSAPGGNPNRLVNLVDSSAARLLDTGRRGAAQVVVVPSQLATPPITTADTAFRQAAADDLDSLIGLTAFVRPFDEPTGPTRAVGSPLASPPEMEKAGSGGGGSESFTPASSPGTSQPFVGMDARSSEMEQLRQAVNASAVSLGGSDASPTKSPQARAITVGPSTLPGSTRVVTLGAQPPTGTRRTAGGTSPGQMLSGPSLPWWPASAAPPDVSPPRPAGGVVSAQGTYIDPPEGQSYNYHVATFTSSNPSSQVSDFLAQIEWQDGTASAGRIDADGAGGYVVHGDHTYLEDGTYSAVVTITDVLSQSTSTVTSTLIVEEAPLQLHAYPIKAVAGQADTFLVAGYGPFQPVDTPTATIDWGDGTVPTVGVVSQTSILGGHLYAEAGTYVVTIRAQQNGGAMVTTTTTAVVSPWHVEGTGKAINPIEGQVFAGTVATIDHPEAFPPGSLSVTINWGDGSSPGTLLPDGQIQGTHTYSSVGAYATSVVITYQATGTTTIQGTAMVLGAPLSGSGAAISPVEGTEFTGTVASFHDANASSHAADFVAVIDWGDGSLSQGTIDGAGGDYTVTGSHTYADDGAYTVTVTVEEQLVLYRNGQYERAAAGKLILQGSAAVADAPIQVFCQPPIAIYYNFTWSVKVGSFYEVDAEPYTEFTAAIDWGDGSSSQGVIAGTSPGSGDVYGSHSYANPGTYQVTLTVTDADGRSQSATSNPITLYLPPPTLPSNVSVTVQEITVQEGQVFSGTVAMILDSHPPSSSYHVRIDWGDNTPLEISDVYNPLDNGVYALVGTHRYVDDGDHAIVVSVWDPYDTLHGYPAPVIATGTAHVTEVPIVQVTPPMSNPLSATEGVPISNQPVATFTYPDPSVPSTAFSAGIDWGDGGSDFGIVTGSNGLFQVLGSHTYLRGGIYPLVVSIVGPGASASSTRTTVTVASDDPPIEAQGAIGLSGTSSVPVGGVLATFTDLDPTPTSYSAFVEWGDGVSTSAGLVGQDGHYQVVGTHIYGQAPTWGRGAYTARVYFLKDFVIRAVATTQIDIAPLNPPSRIDVAALRLATYEGEGITDAQVGTFTDWGPVLDPDCYQADLDWGDGPISKGIIRPVAGVPGKYEVLGSHVYGTRQTGTVQQCYQVKVTVRLTSDLLAPGYLVASGVAYATAVVDRHPLTATAASPLRVGVSTGTLGLQNTGFYNVLVATFTSPNPLAKPSDFQAVIDWGDGHSGYGTLLLVDGTFHVYGSHAYQIPGSFTIQVTIADGTFFAGGATSYTTVTTSVLVADASAGLPEWFDAGSFYLLNPYEWPLTWTIDWGDGSHDSNAELSSLGQDPTWYQYNARNLHAFTDHGDYLITSNATFVAYGEVEPDDFVTAQRGVTVAEASLSTIATVPFVNAVAGTAIPSTVLLTFGDDDPAFQGSFTAVIHWGDGATSQGAVSVNGDHTFRVEGGHTYSRAGKYPVVVTVATGDGVTTSAFTQANVASAVAAFQAHPVGAVTGAPTGDVVVATFTQPDGSADDDVVTIYWGDGTHSAGMLVETGVSSYEIHGAHTYGLAGTYAVQVTVVDRGGRSYQADTFARVFNGTRQAPQLTNDPGYGSITLVGHAQVALNTGDLHLGQQLDFDLSPGTSVGRDPVLTYNSGTVREAPVVQLQLTSNPNDPVPDTVDISFAWDGDDFLPPATFSTFGHQPGEDYLFGLPTYRPDDAESGLHKWKAHVRFHYGVAPSAVAVDSEITGVASIVNNESSPLGAGWSIAGVDRLYPVCGGILWVSGTGDSRLFADVGVYSSSSSDGNYVSPAGDFGSLVYAKQDRSFTYTAKDRTVWHFDANGLLTSVVDTHGLATTYGYDTDHRLTQVSSIDGGLVTLEYGGSGLLASIHEPGGRTWSFSHQGTDLTSLTDPDNKVRTFSYDPQHRPVHEEWAPFVTDYGYTGAFLTSVNQGSGSLWTITPVGKQGRGPIAARVADALGVVTDGHGYTHSYTFDTVGALLTHRRPDLRVESWARDAYHQVTSYQDFLGVATAYAYDYGATGKGDLHSITYPDGSQDVFFYESQFHRATWVSERSTSLSTFTYDPGTGDLLTSVEAAGSPQQATTTYSWSNGLLLTQTDPLGNTVTYGYDGNRRPISEVHRGPGGVVVSQAGSTYDAAGNVRTVTDGTNHTTTYTTDGVNRVVATLDGTGVLTTQSYTAAGLLASFTDGRLVVTTQTYDTRGLLVSSTEAAGTPAARTTVYGYDDAGNLNLEVSPAGHDSHYHYDVNGSRRAETDARGYTSYDLYDDDGRPVGHADERGVTTRAYYDLVGNVTKTVDGNGKASFTHYDLAGRVTKQVDPLGVATFTHYDAADNVTRTVDGNDRSSYFYYDLDGQLTKAVDPLGIDTYTYYDGDGNVTETIDGNERSSYFYYDLDGRVTKQVDSLGIDTYTYYDGDGRVTRTLDGNDREAWTYYDADGQVTEVEDELGISTFYSYDPFGEVTETTDGNGQESYASYDADGRVTEEEDELGVSTFWYYDDEGNVTLTIDGNERSTYFAYDEAGQLVGQVDPLGIGTYQYYDGAGNVTKTTDGNGRSDDTYYDADGRVTKQVDSLGIDTYLYYDAEDYVTKATDGNGQSTYLYYDWDGRLTQEIDGLGVSTYAYYDDDGNVTRTIDGNGQPAYTYYDYDGRATKQVDPLGIATFTYYDDEGNVTQTTDGNGKSDFFHYDWDGQLTQVVDSLGVSTFTYYDYEGNVTRTIDGNGRSDYTYYDDAGQVTRQVDALGVATFAYYDDEGNVTKTTDGVGSSAFAYYDFAGRLTQEVDALGVSTFVYYDNEDNVTRTVDGNGQSTYTHYDLENRATRQVDPLGVATFSYYDDEGDVTQTVDGNGKSDFTHFDVDGRVTKQVDPLGIATYLYYDAEDDVTKATDGNGQSSYTYYDSDGRLTEEVDALGISTFAYYDGDGNVTETVDGNGQSAYTYYDFEGRATKQVDPLGIATFTYYDGEGNVTQTTDGNGTSSYTYYDFEGRATKHVDGRGVATFTYYDGEGNVTRTIDGNGKSSYLHYDGDGRLTKHVDPVGNASFTHYDNDGNVTKAVDGAGHASFLHYDTAGRLTEAIDGQGAVTKYRYDGDGNLTAVVDPLLNETAFAYDDAGRKTSSTDPLGETSTYAYDGDGRLTAATDRLGRRREYAYDAAGQLLSETWRDAGGAVVDARAFSYDDDGHLLTAGNSQGAYTFTYDTAGRMTGEQGPFGLSLTFAHDGAGNRTSVTDSLGGLTASTYDGAGQLLSRTFQGNGAALRFDQVWTGAGQLKGGKRYGSAGAAPTVGASVLTYDDAGRLTRSLSKDGAGGTTGDYVYAYDGAGWVTSQTIDGTATGYGYDGSGQLLQAGATAYTYDAAGNRTTSGYQTGPNNRLLSDGAWSYAYDDEGNRTGKTKVGGPVAESWAYAYDQANQLTLATHTVGGTVVLTLSYAYDAFGQRVQEQRWTQATGTQVRRFGYDGGDVWADLDGNDALLTRYVRPDGTDALAARVSAAGAVAWYVQDRQGSVRALTDSAGVVQDRITYDAYGQVVSESNAAFGDRYKYTAREYDAGSGLQYNRARWYDAATGRWVSEDPIGFDAGDANLARYVGNGPTNRTDPSGLMPPYGPSGYGGLGGTAGGSLSGGSSLPRGFPSQGPGLGGPWGGRAEAFAPRPALEEDPSEPVAVAFQDAEGNLHLVGMSTQGQATKLRLEEERSQFLVRPLAFLGLIGDLATIASGAAIAYGSSPTVGGAVIGLGLVGKGADGAWANVRTLYDGKGRKSYFQHYVSKGIQAAGASEEKADLLTAGIEFAISLAQLKISLSGKGPLDKLGPGKGFSLGVQASVPAIRRGAGAAASGALGIDKLVFVKTEVLVSIPVERLGAMAATLLKDPALTAAAAKGGHILFMSVRPEKGAGTAANTESNNAGGIPPGAKGSPEHKAAAWQAYLDSFKPGGQNAGKTPWTYERWEPHYHRNIGRMDRSVAGVNEYRMKHATWAEPGEVYLSKADLPPGVDARHFDIANRRLQKAVELKEFQGGARDVASIGNDLKKEVAADKALREAGWDIKWVFKGYKGVSKGLKDLLDAAKIPYEVIK